MKVILKNNLKTAFFSKEMLISLIIGIGLVLSHFVQYVVPLDVYNMAGGFCPESVYYNWIGSNCFPLQSYVYYLIMPILATLPNGAVYFDERKNRYMFQIYVRGGKNAYLLSNYITTFLSGGVAFVLPLLLSFVLTGMKFPMLKPEPVVGIGPTLTCIMPYLFYEKPLIYTLLFLVIDFVFAGGIAIFALVAAFYVEHKFLVFVLPFTIYYSIYCINNIVGGIDYAPNYFLIPGSGNNNQWEFIIGLVIIIGVSICFFGKGLRDELI